MTNFALQRRNMVESQVRPSDVTDRRIIRAMTELPREVFVPEALRDLAYMDEDLRLPAGPGSPPRGMLAPRTLAKLVQAANLEPDARVLLVGANTGYTCAVVGAIAGEVIALESDERWIAIAREALKLVGATNVDVHSGELTAGWVDKAPYDAILLEGQIARVPPALLDQLKDEGRLLAVLGSTSPDAVSRATVWQRIGMRFEPVTLFEVGGIPLPGFEQPAEFAF